MARLEFTNIPQSFIIAFPEGPFKLQPRVANTGNKIEMYRSYLPYACKLISLYCPTSNIMFSGVHHEETIFKP